ncbi:MAG: hypothetical protein V2B18_22010 [Pseudomonadota bacterium]
MLYWNVPLVGAEGLKKLSPATGRERALDRLTMSQVGLGNLAGAVLADGNEERRAD